MIFATMVVVSHVGLIPGIYERLVNIKTSAVERQQGYGSTAADRQFTTSRCWFLMSFPDLIGESRN